MPLQSQAPGAYHVLMNRDQQLVAWPAGQPSPDGWHATSVGGSQADCVAYIEVRWNSRDALQSSSDDLPLVERLRSGDEAAFGALVDRYHASFVRLAQAYVRDRSI